MNWTTIFGIASGIITLVGLLIYAKSVVTGDSKPSRVTWFLWTLNSVLLLTSYDASGAGETVWLAGGYAAGLFIIAILTIKYGEPGWSWLDRFCLIGAIIGALLWWITGSPLTAYVSTLIIDFFGVLPTIQKSWKNPEEEDLLSWTVLLFAGFLSLFAVEEWSLVIAWYPLQITITTAIIVWFLIRPRKNA